jgi:hypothetical protein
VHGCPFWRCEIDGTLDACRNPRILLGMGLLFIEALKETKYWKYILHMQENERI